jgi:hypothetical protein
LGQRSLVCATPAIELRSVSALGQKRTSHHVRSMSALPPKADIRQGNRDVRFVPLADFGSVQQAGFSPCFGEWAERGGGSAAAELSRTNIMLGRGRHARTRYDQAHQG